MLAVAASVDPFLCSLFVFAVLHNLVNKACYNVNEPLLTLKPLNFWDLI